MLRIGIYGNNLNTGYFLAGYMRRLGVTATLILPQDSHEQDTHHWWTNQAFDETLVRWVPRIHSLGCPGDLKLQSSIRQLYEVVSQFEVLLLREEGPALFSELNGPVKVFAAQGADLQLWPFWLEHMISVSGLSAAMKFSFRQLLITGHSQAEAVMMVARQTVAKLRSAGVLHRMQSRQRAGIDQCRRAIVFPYQTHLLDRLGYPRSQVRYVPLPNTPPELLANEHYDTPPALVNLSRSMDLLLVHPARMFFLERDSNPYRKDNDKLLMGFARFVKSTSLKVHMILLEKGLDEDILFAKRLIQQHDMNEYVTWLPELPNTVLRGIYKLPGVVVCDQFSANLSALGNTGRESVFFGCPLITSYDGADDVMYSEAPPNVYTANSDDSVFAALVKVSQLTVTDRENLRIKCVEWYEQNLDPVENTRRYLTVIDEAMADHQRLQRVAR
jgi:hypothetical protein